MSKRLLEVIQTFLIKQRKTVAYKALADAVDRDPATVRRWVTEKFIPGENDRYRIALACGLSEQEALALARTGASERKRSA